MFSVREIIVCVALLFLTIIVSANPTKSILRRDTRPPKIELEEQFESTPSCSSRKHLINTDDLFESSNEIWNFDENFSQMIEVEVCENENTPCAEHPTLKTKCRQKFISIQLQVVSRNSTLSELRSFSIPSNCECAYLRSSSTSL